MFTREDITKLSELARIGLDDSEKDKLAGEVESILKYVDQIKNAKVDINAEARVGAVKNVFREDSVLNPAGSNTDILLKEAPHSDKGYVSVKKILGGSSE